MSLVLKLKYNTYNTYDSCDFFTPKTNDVKLKHVVGQKQKTYKAFHYTFGDSLETS